MNETRILVSGLPGTGKTTFIAALWCYVKSDAPEKSLTKNSLVGVEHEYLNSIANDWMEYKIPGRSLQNIHFEKVVLPLKRVSDSQPVVMEIPDIAGEKFRDHFDLREWSKEFDSLLHNVTGILVFVNPLAANNQPKFIADAIESEALLGAVGLSADMSVLQEAGAKKDSSEVLPKPTLNNWDIKYVPNQVKIIEGLQFLHHHKTLQMPLKLSIIISAWDAVPGADEIEPERWLENNLSMLYQYLQCNTDKFNSCFFGVSAQGCDYENEAEIDTLIDKPLHERIQVKHGKDTGTDITQTITWMI